MAYLMAGGIIDENLHGNKIIHKMFDKVGDNILCLFWIRPYTDSGSKIIDKLNYYHFCSGDKLNFFLPGYMDKEDEEYSYYSKSVKVDKKDWYYSDEVFNVVKEHIKSISKWEYSGNSEIMLIQCEGNEMKFDKVLIFNLDQMLKDNVIDSFDTFIERFFDEIKDKNNIDEVSNALGKKTGIELLLDILINKLPIKLGDFYKKEKYFGVLNLKK